MKRFLPWLVPIVLLLAAVPLLLIRDAVVAAKVAGVAVVVLTSVAIRFWLLNAGKLRVRSGKVRFTVNERYFLNEVFPLYKRLSARERSGLEERAGMLLAEIALDRYDGADVGREEGVALAVALALAVAGQPYNSCRGKIVVFREGVSPELIFQDETPVLFIAETDLKQVLRAADTSGPAANFPSGMRETLLRFYELRGTGA